MAGAFLQSVIITVLANLVSFVVLYGWSRFTTIQTGLPPEQFYFGLYHIVTLYVSLMLWYWLGTFEGMGNRIVWTTLAFMIATHFALYFAWEYYEPQLREAFFPGCTQTPIFCLFLQRFGIVL